MGNIKVGSKVKLISNGAGSMNRVGDVGVVSEDVYGNGDVFRVIVKGITDGNYANRSRVIDLELVEANTKEEQEREIERILQEILEMFVKLNKGR